MSVFRKLIPNYAYIRQSTFMERRIIWLWLRSNICAKISPDSPNRTSLALLENLSPGQARLSSPQLKSAWIQGLGSQPKGPRRESTVPDEEKGTASECLFLICYTFLLRGKGTHPLRSTENPCDLSYAFARVDFYLAHPMCRLFPRRENCGCRVCGFHPHTLHPRYSTLEFFS
jgi:hypothetical protein